jgi:D-alanine-D-alanine ligase
MKINKHIEIVRATKGGHSSMGKRSCEMIQAVLARHYRHVGITITNDASDLGLLIAKQPDLVFLGARSVLSDSDNSSAGRVWLGDYLDEAGINYTSSTTDALAIDIRKPMANQVVKAAGLDTPEYFSTYTGEYASAQELPLAFPLFIKPPNGGGSTGIGADSVVRDFAGFEQKVASIAELYKADALVEAYLTGREFSVAILQTLGGDEPLAMPIELMTERNSNGDRILGKDVKSADTERVVAVTDVKIKQAVADLALNVFRALGARDYGRIDIRMDQHGVPYFLEANLLPGLSGHDSIGGYFTRACRMNQDMNYESMILHIVELALERSQQLTPSVTDIIRPPLFDGIFEPA